jgi:hypothetical protein
VLPLLLRTAPATGYVVTLTGMPPLLLLLLLLFALLSFNCSCCSV